LVARMIPSREAHDILLGMLACTLDLGAIPRNAVWDNEAALVSRHDGRPNLTEPFQRFRRGLGMGVIVCRPGDPEAKGLAERANRYLETSFLPGRRFSGPPGLQRAARCLVEEGERPHALDAALLAGRPHRRGPRRDDGAATGVARSRLARDQAPGSRPLGSRRHV